MIQKFVDQFMESKATLEARFAAAHPDSYKDIVEAVIRILHEDDSEYYRPDPTRIHMIDDGEFQGTLLFVIGSTGYQPSYYWYVKVRYGSCSSCDTLQGVRDFGNDTPSASQVKDYMTLALHVVQGLKAMQED